jgi:hypothetical protein
LAIENGVFNDFISLAVYIELVIWGKMGINHWKYHISWIF